MDFALGAIFSGIMILAALGFAYPNHLHQWMWDLAIAIAVVIFIFFIGLYACVWAEKDRKRRYIRREPESNSNIEVSTNYQVHRLSSVTQPEDPKRKNDEAGDGSSFWNLTYNCTWKFISFLATITVDGILLAGVTGLLVFIALLQWQTLQSTDVTLRTTLVRANRAWLLAESPAAPTGTINGIESITPYISIVNIGKEPSSDVETYLRPFWLAVNYDKNNTTKSVDMRRQLAWSARPNRC
jgi:hypothetical protein